ncbi:MAG: J domain-containing protein [Silvanigrellales bacterium]|nr:J domain-containing protein [Silvanigrellales bacterium]
MDARSNVQSKTQWGPMVERKVEELLSSASRALARILSQTSSSGVWLQAPEGETTRTLLFDLLPEILLLLGRVRGRASEGDVRPFSAPLKARAQLAAMEKDTAKLEDRVNAALHVAQQSGHGSALEEALLLVLELNARVRGLLLQWAQGPEEPERPLDDGQTHEAGDGFVRKGALGAGSRPTAAETFRKREDKKRRVEEKKALRQTFEGFARGGAAQGVEEPAPLVDDILELAKRYKEGSLPWAAKVLGIPVTADLERARKQFRLRARDFHPDASNHPRTVEAFHLLQRAWEAFEALTTRASSNPRERK